MSLSPVFNEALILHQQNKLPEAEQFYRQALAAEPANFHVWHRLAILYLQQQRGGDALVAAEKALTIDPRAAELWMLRGVALRTIKRHAEALESFDRTIALAPGALPALYNRGETLLELDRPRDALAAFDQMLAQDPKICEAWNNRGAAQQRLGQFAESIASYDKALALRPDFTPSLSNRASALWGLRRYDEALADYDKALELAPGFAQAWIYRSAVLYAMHRFSDALASLDKALALEPDNESALFARGGILCESGDVAEGFSAFRGHAQRVYGHRDAFIPTDLGFKQRHDQEQRDYLASQGIVSGKYHLAPGARVTAPAVNPNPAAEAEWRQSNPKMVVIDNFLSAEALEGLRRYCWESTFWQDAHAEGYLGAMPERGFGCPLLAQIAEELQNRFPGIFAGKGLRKLWAFKYDSSLTGIDVHADPAAVNVNFWITPDDANRDPAHGGMVIWDAAAPLDWNFERYNGDVAATRAFLAGVGAKSQTVPYRNNRVVIFDSDLFHETDVIAFKDGYLNRRINVTLLFGRRVADGS